MRRSHVILLSALAGCGQRAAGDAPRGASAAPAPGPSASAAASAAPAPASRPAFVEEASFEGDAFVAQPLANAVVVCEGDPYDCSPEPKAVWIVDAKGKQKATELVTKGAWDGGHATIRVTFSGEYPALLRAQGLGGYSDAPYLAVRDRVGGAWVEGKEGLRVPPSGLQTFPPDTASLPVLQSAPAETNVLLGPGRPLAYGKSGVYAAERGAWKRLDWAEHAPGATQTVARLADGGAVLVEGGAFWFVAPDGAKVEPLPIPKGDPWVSKLLPLEKELWLVSQTKAGARVFRGPAIVRAEGRSPERWGKTSAKLPPIAKADAACATPFVRLGTAPLSPRFEKELAGLAGHVELAAKLAFYETRAPYPIFGAQARSAAEAQALAALVKPKSPAVDVICLDLQGAVPKLEEPAENVRVVPVKLADGREYP